MKTNYILLLACALVMSASLQAQTAKDLGANGEMIKASGPIMTFESTIVEYGEIVQNSEPLRVAKFTNTGTEPLIIQSARGSCGCTVPTYPKEPIMPGESGQLEIRYDTKRLGQINKTVTVTTNEGGEGHTLKVVGVIQPAQEDGVPKPKNGLIKPN